MSIASVLTLAFLATGVAAGRAQELQLRFEPSSLTVAEASSGLLVGLVLETADCPGLVRLAEGSAAVATRDVGSARGGVDFALLTETLPLGAVGVSPISIGRLIPGVVLDDAAFEADESFELALGSVAAEAECLPSDPQAEVFPLELVVGAPALVTIADDESVELELDDVSGTEGDAGETAFAFVATLSQAPAEGHRVSVGFATADGSASASSGDYRALEGAITFEAGQSSQTISVAVLGDRRIEGDETFFVELTALPERVTAARDRAIGTIRDDEAPPVVTLDPVAMDEGDAGRRDFVFQARLSAPSEQAVVVPLSLRDGSAKVGSDYLPVWRDTLVFDPGTTAMPVPVTVLGDRDFEDDESFFLRVGEAEAEGTILNDDDPQPQRLRVVSGNDQKGPPGSRLGEPLTVEVIGEDREPLEGVILRWTVTRGTARLDMRRTDSEADGRSSNGLELGAEPGEVTVEVRVAGAAGVAPKTFTAVIDVDDDGIFVDVEGLDPDVELPVGEALNELCPRSELSDDLRKVCDDVRELRGVPGGQGPALREIAPEEVSSTGTVAVEAQVAHLRQVGARLAALRGGAARLAGAQVALDLGGVDLGGETIASLFEPRLPEVDVFALLSAHQRAALAEDSAGAAEEPPRDPLPAGSAELGGRWGFFVNGTVGRGERDQTNRETGFDLDTWGLTAGVDYRLSERLFLGAALGWRTSDVELAGASGGVDAESYQLTAYGAYDRSRFYLDGVVSYGRSELEVERVIEFPDRPRLVARGQPDGSELALGLGAGYRWSLSAWNLEAFGRADYGELDLDGYRERGAPGFDLVIGSQDVESLLVRAGLQVSRALSLRWGILSPTLRLSALRELEDDSRPIEASFAGDPGGTTFAIPTDDPDRDFLNLGVGLSAVLRGGKQLFVFYDQDLARDDLDLYQLTFGLRLEL